MIGQLLLPVRTAIALKSNTAIRISEGYRQSQRIGVLHTYTGEEQLEVVNGFMDRLEAEGKTVDSMAYIPTFDKNQDYRFPHFSIKDIDSLGNWGNPVVAEFCQQPFDYLLNLDLNANKVTENILARSKSKCRVGRFEEGKSEYFELMIDHKEGPAELFMEQVHYYLKNVRNE